MSTSHPHVAAVPLPPQSAIVGGDAPVSFADAYAVVLPPGTSTSPERLARFIFAQQAPWVGVLMRLRDALVAGFGLKTARHLASLDTASAATGAGRVGIFKVYDSNATEIVMGEDDKHLDFRLSVMCTGGAASAAGERRLVLSTVVRCHNRLGRAYIFVIAPFHRLIVRSCLRRAARLGWPPSSR